MKNLKSFNPVFYFISVLICIILQDTSTFAQSQNRAWIIPDQQVLFSATPTASTLANNSGLTASTCYNSMQDANGN